MTILPTVRRSASTRRVELGLFVFTGVAYALPSAGMLWRQSPAPHFVYQAHAFLRGQLHLTAPPPSLNDWVLVGGRWYVGFPPFPAVLMMPFVALRGLAFGDVAFTVFFGALNVPLLYVLLRQIATADDEQPASGDRPPWEHAAHALVYGFGTIAWYCAIRGEVWFTAETVGVTLTLLYLLAAHRARHPMLAGTALACAALTRTPLAFSGIFFVLEMLAEGGALNRAGLSEWIRNRARRNDGLRQLLAFGLPIAAVGAAMAWMNWARFGDAGEFGHRLLYANRVNAQVRQYGLFHYHFLERNLHAAFTRLPALEFNPLRLGFNGDGMSLFVTTPLFALLLWPKERSRLHGPLWLTAALIAVPGFFYQNGGWYQFGFRFSLDYTPYLVLLLSLGRWPLTRVWWGLALAGVAVNAWGAAVFNRFG